MVKLFFCVFITLQNNKKAKKQLYDSTILQFIKTSINLGNVIS